MTLAAADTARARVPGGPGPDKGTIDLCRHGLKGLQLMRRSLGRLDRISP
jgi:hypothetical protein